MRYEELEDARLTLINTILRKLTCEDREFLVSINRGEPNWEWIGLPNVQYLPGVQWKLLNIQKMDVAKKEKDINELKKKLDM